MDEPVSFPENWAPPRELARALPRDVRMLGRGILKAVFAVVLIVASIPLFLFMRAQAASQEVDTQALREHGAQVTGEVARLWTRDRPTTHMVGYFFTAGGQRTRGEAAVPEKLWAHVQKAGMIPIRYLPSNPTISHPAEWDPDGTPAWVSFLLPAMLLFSSAILLVSVRRQANLLADGLPAPAVVTGCHRIKGGWAANYRFRTQDGAIKTGRSTGRRKRAVGEAVCVLYLPEAPGRSAIYPLCSYRIA